MKDFFEVCCVFVGLVYIMTHKNYYFFFSWMMIYFAPISGSDCKLPDLVFEFDGKLCPHK